MKLSLVRHGLLGRGVLIVLWAVLRTVTC